MNRKVIVSGGFDPIHSGHLDLLESASKYGDVIVLLNSDKWLSLKKGRPFLSFDERKKILESIKYVSEVREAQDFNSTVRVSLQELLLEYKPEQLIFANGGDRNETTTPEEQFCWEHKIRTIYDCGGEKIQSSSQLLADYWYKKFLRDWGSWIVFRNYSDKVKLKELIVEPKKSLSHQRHFQRSEFWFVAEGKGQLLLNSISQELNQFDIIKVDQGSWHLLSNPYDKNLKIIEIQFGNICSEEDIERQ